MKKPTIKHLVFVLLFCFVYAPGFSKPIKVTSPDSKIEVLIELKDKVFYQVSYDGKVVIASSPLTMTLYDGKILGANAKLSGSIKEIKVNQEVKPLYGIASTYHDNYNSVRLDCKGDYSIVFKVYNSGVAYRFETRFKSTIKVKEEEISYKFAGDFKGFYQVVPQFLTSYEAHYVNEPLSYLDSNKIAVLPLYVDVNGIKVVITESDLLDYPGVYLTYDGSKGLQGVLPKRVSKDEIGGCCPNFNKVPKERFDYLAETAGTRTFPWRIATIALTDKELLNNNLVYLLASECKLTDVSWIKPGKVAWDWWNANNLTGVDFKTGYNTSTYKYYIDFASRNGIPYIIMDEGWSDQFDLLKLNDGSVKIGTNPSLGAQLDMNELFSYAKKKNVGIVLWCVWYTLDRQLTEALDQFQKWGVAGIKVDFMDRDDQDIVNYYERVAKETAKRHLLVNFHGAYKPTGLERTYPNVINREAVQGLEYNKFSDQCTPEHAVTIPFIRMLAGPMDYTPGAMTNVNKADFRVIQSRPMSQGTRCQQLAMFTMYYAPLEMLADAPTAYEKEPDILKFISAIPVVWDETVPLDGKCGDYAVLARRKGDLWWIGAMTDWSPRTIQLAFSFLPAGTYEIEFFNDGANSERMGNDYKREVKRITEKDIFSIDMAAGGGWAAKINPVR